MQLLITLKKEILVLLHNRAHFSNGTVFIGGNADRQSEASYVQISVNDDGNVSVNNFIQSINNVTGSIKGHLRIAKKGDSSKFFNVFNQHNREIIQNQVVFLGFLNVTNLSYSEVSPFSDDDDVLLSFAMVGTTGDKGGKRRSRSSRK